MSLDRRTFIQTSLGAGLASTLAVPGHATTPDDPIYEKLDNAAARPVLKKELFPDPVIIDSVELLRYENNFLCRVRSKDGAEGLCVSHNFRMIHLYPMFLELVQPYFSENTVDARDLESLLHDLYLYKNNYKYQGMPIWIPLATLEIAILDMLGNISGKPIAELIGDILHNKIAIYRANNNRGKTAKESIESIKELAKETGAKAVKFKIGGRMLAPEEPPGRTEKLIPLMRETFPDKVIYADANCAYTAEEAIRVGKILAENKIDLFEQPVPFDYYASMKKVADAVDIPLASGGVETSHRNFRWFIGEQIFHMVQQDIFYFGGMIRCMRVARMAETAGILCTPHISGTGLGYAYMLQFVSTVPNAGPYHEFKGLSKDIPFECATSSLKSEKGLIKVPTGPGDGIDIDPDFIKKHKPLKL